MTGPLDAAHDGLREPTGFVDGLWTKATTNLNCRVRRLVARGHNELAIRAGRYRPARGYRYRVIKEELRATVSPSTISWKDPRAAEYGRRFGEAMRRANGYRLHDSEVDQ